MSRIIKTISLDKESDEIASKKKNFSAWVRKQLKEESSLVEYNHTEKVEGLRYVSPDELKLLTKNHYDGVIPIPKTTINDYEPLDPPMRKQKERKYLRRALKYIWSFI